MTAAKKQGGGCLRRLALLVLVAALAAAAAAGYAWSALARPYKGYPQDEATVVVAAGSGGARILAQLADAGVVRDPRLARLYLVHVLGDPPLQAGEYVFRGPLTTPQVLDKLVRGEVSTQAVTIIEGLTLDEVAARLVEAGFGPPEDVQQAVHDPTPILDLDPHARDLEGYLFPETYHFSRGTTPRVVVKALVDAFRAGWKSDVAPALAGAADAPADNAGAVATGAVGTGAQATGAEATGALATGAVATGAATTAPAPVAGGRRRRALSLRELVTLASIVEKEARLPEERPVIAGVYRNRIDQGIALYADPTVIYALQRLGRWDGNLRKADLQVDSPYNTYRYAGLPPGPICSPGLASLVAAARPADVPYLYFVSRNDGSHVFASTLAEHNRNVAEWQKRYWRQRR